MPCLVSSGRKDRTHYHLTNIQFAVHWWKALVRSYICIKHTDADAWWVEVLMFSGTCIVYIVYIVNTLLHIVTAALDILNPSFTFLISIIW